LCNEIDPKNFTILCTGKKKDVGERRKEEKK